MQLEHKAVDLDVRSRKRITRNITPDKLLDAAELLFADNGYDGTSLRAIADLADQHVGLTTYHFKSKQLLFDKVIERRATEINALRLAHLSDLDFEVSPSDELVKGMIWAYALPMIEARRSNSPQRLAHIRLVAGMISQKRWVPLIRKHYDPCAAVFLAHWRRLMPEANYDSLLNAFSFMASTMLYACSYSDRFGHWKEHQDQEEAEEMATVSKDFIDFVYAGFVALCRADR